MRRTIAGVGRTLVTLGLLILLFVAYQLWGTGVWTARAQDRLDRDFEKALAEYDDPVIEPGPTSSTLFPQPTTTTTSRPRPAPPVPEEGDWVGKITISRIGLEKIFVEGTDAEELRDGPGHYPGSPMPGTLGNAAIAGHRTTYGAPFGEIDKLKAGDEIIIDMPGTGRFVYEVYRPELLAVAHQAQLGSDHLIVGKRDVWVVDATSDAQLTLTSCHPKGSAEQRIVVKAKLVKNKSSKPTKPAPQRPNAGKSLGEGLEQGLSGTHAGLEPTIGWGIVTFVVGIAWWWAFRRWRHPLTWVLGLIPFLGVLAPFYFFLERALPAGY